MVRDCEWFREEKKKNQLSGHGAQGKGDRGVYVLCLGRVSVMPE